MKNILIARATFASFKFVLHEFDNIDDALKNSSRIQSKAFDEGECGTGCKLVYALNAETALKNLKNKKNHLPNSNI